MKRKHNIVSKGFEIKCDKCWLTMRHVPGVDYPYSDHEGVAAEFTVRERENGRLQLHYSYKLFKLKV